MLIVLQVPQDDCPDWTQYLEGITPKERREMLDRQWMLEQEEKRRRADRRATRAELRIAREAAGATKSAATYQLAAVIVAAIAIAVSAWFAMRDERPIVNVSNVPVLTSPQSTPDTSGGQP